MIKFTSHPGFTGNTDHRAIFGGSRITGGVPGVNAIQPNAWLPRAVNVYELNHIRASALGAGNSITVTVQDGTSVAGTLTMDNDDGTDNTATFTGTLSAASAWAPADAHLYGHAQVGSGTGGGTFALVYQDAANEALSYHNAGTGTQNISVGGTDEYIAIYGTGTAGATTEAQAQSVWPSPGTLSNFCIGYDTDPDNAYNCLVRVNGATQATIAMANAPTGNLVTDTSSVTVAAGDLVCFGFTRTAGSNTALVVSVTFTFEAD